MCVLDNTDMSKHVSDVDSITRRSSDSEKQILFQTESTVLNQTAEKENEQLSSNQQCKDTQLTHRTCSHVSRPPQPKHISFGSHAVLLQ